MITRNTLQRASVTAPSLISNHAKKISLYPRCRTDLEYTKHGILFRKENRINLAFEDQHDHDTPDY